MGDREFEMMRQGRVVVQTHDPGKLKHYYSPAAVSVLPLYVPASRECQLDVH